jgi:hypothetical protein
MIWHDVMYCQRARLGLRKYRQQVPAGCLRNADEPCAAADVVTQRQVVDRVLKFGISNGVWHEQRERIVVTYKQLRIRRHCRRIRCFCDHHVILAGIQTRIDGRPEPAREPRTDLHRPPWNFHDPKAGAVHQAKILPWEGLGEQPLPQIVLEMLLVEVTGRQPTAKACTHGHAYGTQRRLQVSTAGARLVHRDHDAAHPLHAGIGRQAASHGRLGGAQARGEQAAAALQESVHLVVRQRRQSTEQEPRLLRNTRVAIQGRPQFE